METWVHGIATIVEYPERIKLLKRSGDFGTVVEQDAVSGANDNWFHIPIPTPRSAELKLNYFRLIAKVNDKAVVDKINLGSGTAMLLERSVSYVDTTIKDKFTFNNILYGSPTRDFTDVSGVGVLISVHVVFRPGTPLGRVEFYGGGVNFG